MPRPEISRSTTRNDKNTDPGSAVYLGSGTIKIARSKRMLEGVRLDGDPWRERKSGHVEALAVSACHLGSYPKSILRSTEYRVYTSIRARSLTWALDLRPKTYAMRNRCMIISAHHHRIAPSTIALQASHTMLPLDIHTHNTPLGIGYRASQSKDKGSIK